MCARSLSPIDGVNQMKQCCHSRGGGNPVNSNSICFVLSLLAQRKDERKGAPMNPPYGFVRSLGKIRSQLTRCVSLRSNKNCFPRIFSSLTHRVQRGVKKQEIWRDGQARATQISLLSILATRRCIGGLGFLDPMPLCNC